jgi:hypothetical protein
MYVCQVLQIEEYYGQLKNLLLKNENYLSDKNIYDQYLQVSYLKEKDQEILTYFMTFLKTANF